MIPSTHPLRDAVGPQTQPAGAWIWLDSRFNVLHSNPAALALLAANPTLLRVRRHQLHALQEPALLKSSLQQAAQGQPTALALARPGRLPLTLRAERWAAAPPPAALVLSLRDPELETPNLAGVQAMLKLTLTEASVVAALSQGRSTAEIAEAMAVQPNTVQAHIKRVLTKSGTNRQAQLVALVLRSVVMVAHGPGAPSRPPARPTPRPTSPPTRGGSSK